MLIRKHTNEEYVMSTIVYICPDDIWSPHQGAIAFMDPEGNTVRMTLTPKAVRQMVVAALAVK